MVRGGRVLAALLVVLGAAACSGQAPQPAPAPAPLVVDETGAGWAVAMLDPCALLSPDVVDGIGDASDPYLVAPHACAVDYTRPGGARDRLTVTVGAAFDTAARAAAAPATLSELHAYLLRDVPAAPTALTPSAPKVGAAKVVPRCVAAVPISPTRAIEIDAAAETTTKKTVDPAGDDAGPVDVATACTAATTIGEPLAAKLGSPADRVRTAAPGDFGRFEACGLLQSALGLTPDRSAYSSPTADSCRATHDPQQPGPDASAELSGAAGPATLPAPGLGTRAAVTTVGPAQETPLPSACRVVAVAQPLPDAPAAAAAQVVTFTERQQADDPCAEAVTDLESVMTAVGGAAPDAPQAPARLGYPATGPDDVVPVACGVPDAGPADTCRGPRSVVAPAGASALLAQATAGPTAADTTCAVLQAVAQPITGDLQVAALDGTGCVGLAADGYSVTLSFSGSKAGDACSGGESAVVDGRTGLRCHASDDTFDLTVPAVGTTADGNGAMRLDGRLLPARGDHTTVRPKDQEHVSDLTRRLASALIDHSLQPG